MVAANSLGSIQLRPGTPEDSYAVFVIFETAIADLGERLGTAQFVPPDAETLARRWPQRRALFEHLAATCDQFWVAEREGEIVGFARSIRRDDVCELTEFFVTPAAQSAGIGRELLARAFPRQEGTHRYIIATADLRAQARYLKLGVYPRFPIYNMWCVPEPVDVATDLAFVPAEAAAETVAQLGAVDTAVLGHRRDVDHIWLLGERRAFVYKRNGRVVGYGYLGSGCGPFALLDAADFPAVLAHAEREASVAGHKRVAFEVPMINATAVDYLLSRGCRLEPFFAFFMSDVPVGSFERYLVTSPPFFL